MKIRPSIIGRKQDKRADILFFGDSPEEEDARTGRAFTGKAGELLRRLIEVELPGKYIVLDNTVPVWMDGEKINKEVRDRHIEHRKKAIARYRPKVVVLLGEHAIKGMGLKGKPVGNSGRIDRAWNRTVVYGVHPSYYLHNISELPKYTRMFQGIRTALRRSSTARVKRERFEAILTLEALDRALTATEHSLTAFDLETSGLKPGKAIILTAAWASAEGAWAVPLYHKESTLNARQVQKRIMTWWSKGPRIVHNGAFELLWMRHHGGKDPKELYDTLIECRMFNENNPAGLDYAVVQYLKKKPYWLDLPENAGTYDTVALPKLLKYNALDAIYTLKLHEYLTAKFTESEIKLVNELYVPLVKICVSMKERGICLDRDELKRIKVKQEKLIKKLTKAREKEFPGVNVSSPKQMRELLYGELRLRPVRRTRTPGAKRLPSTDSKSIERMVDQEPRLAAIAEERRAKSLLKRILFPWLDEHGIDGYLRSSFSTHGAVTGRFTSSNPNLQNVDRKGAQRTAMVSRFKNGKILQFDYSQHEMRCDAAIAGVEWMLDAYKHGRDLHDETVKRLADIGIHTDRPRAKNVNFSVLYEISPAGLHEQYGIPEAEGRVLLKSWLKMSPEQVRYYGRVRDQMESNKCVTNIFGHKRHVHRTHSRRELRQGGNFGIQSVAFEICGMSMIAAEEYLTDMKSLLILQIHDSVVIDAHPSEVKRLMRVMPKIMEQVDWKSFCPKKKDRELPLMLKADAKADVHF